MRFVILILVEMYIGIVVLGNRQPNVQSEPTVFPTTTATELPDDFTELSTFVPSYPCEPENASAFDEQLFCRSEILSEQVVAQGQDAVFIARD